MFERRKLTLFLTCLSVAILAWLFFALSNKYIYRVSTQVQYINSPTEKVYHPLQSDTVSLEVQSTGWELVFARMRIAPHHIKVDLQGLNTGNYITISEQLSRINRQLASDQQIVSVLPDTLYFDFTSRSTKKVPVSLAYDIRYKERYNSSGPIQISPRYVTVTGPSEEISRIKYWPTDSLRKSGIGADISAKLLLKRSWKPEINVFPAVVNVKIPVGEFTEKSLEIPLKVVNNKGYDIKLLPEKVTVTFLTALGNYSKINRKSMEAVIDMDNWQKGYKQLPVKLISFPAFCKFVSIQPQIVDFIIR